MGVAMIGVEVHHEGVFDEDRRTTVRDNNGLTGWTSTWLRSETREAYVTLLPSCIANFGFSDHST